MGIINGGNGRVKCEHCGRESGENDATLHGFKKTVYYDQDGFETYKKILCLVCAEEQIEVEV